MKTQGFTLIELLVAMALLGIVLASLMAFQSSSLKFSAGTSGQAQRMQTIQEAGSYLTDRLRSASQVSTALTFNGSACTITTPESSCFALVVPNAADQPEYFVYRVIPRSELSTSDKRPDAWADTATNKVYALVEYRGGTTYKPTNFSDAIPADLSMPTITPNVVMDYLSVDFVNTTFPTLFSYDATTGKAVLNLQVKQGERGQARLTPAATPYTFTVYPRNR